MIRRLVKQCVELYHRSETILERRALGHRQHVGESFGPEVADPPLVKQLGSFAKQASHVLSVTRASGGHGDSSWACAAHVDPEHVVGEGRARVVALSGEYFQSISLVLSPLLASRHAVELLQSSKSREP